MRNPSHSLRGMVLRQGRWLFLGIFGGDARDVSIRGNKVIIYWANLLVCGLLDFQATASEKFGFPRYADPYGVVQCRQLKVSSF